MVANEGPIIIPSGGLVPARSRRSSKNRQSTLVTLFDRRYYMIVRYCMGVQKVSMLKAKMTGHTFIWEIILEILFCFAIIVSSVTRCSY